MPRDIRFEIPDRGPPRIVSREYKIFREEERFRSLPRSLYEKACRTSVRVLKIEPDADTRKKIQSAIEFSHLHVTPQGVASLTMLFAFFISLPLLLLVALDLVGLPGISVGHGILGLIILIPFIYYLYTYPLRLKKKYELEAGSEIVTMILYMAMYMRNIPNLEGAVKFASENLTGVISYELRKLMWDLETRRYTTVEQALRAYAEKWEKNREFVESIELLVTSLGQLGERRLGMLDEAVDLVLQGHREKTKHFNQNLKMPVAIVHAIGILLPVLGLVLFPIVSVFLDVKAIVLFIGYDIILPFILFFIITNILEVRPVTYSKIDISENPDLPAEGKFFYKGRQLRAWPFGLVVGAVITALGLALFMVEGQDGILSAVLIVAGPVYGVALYYLLLSKKRLELREKTRAIEDEFAEAVFQVGNEIRGGVPIEMSMERSMKRIEALHIKDLFRRALNNMRNLGMTFDKAFFDREYGAIRYYPSKLIKSVMKTVVETTKKGVRTAAAAMISVSTYLKNIHTTQEEVREMLADSVSSLKFQAYFLSPFISGVIVTMAILIIRILQQLGERLDTAALGGAASVPFLPSFGQVNISTFEFVLVIAIYLVETAFILSYFINGIESGADEIGRKATTAYTLMIGYFVFCVSLFATLAIFGPLILYAI